MSGWADRSGAFLALAEPPYWMRMASATFAEAFSEINLRMPACVACASSGVAVRPVPMAQTGSYAMTTCCNGAEAGGKAKICQGFSGTQGGEGAGATGSDRWWIKARWVQTELTKGKAVGQGVGGSGEGWGRDRAQDDVMVRGRMEWKSIWQTSLENCGAWRRERGAGSAKGREGVQWKRLRERDCMTMSWCLRWRANEVGREGERVGMCQNEGHLIRRGRSWVSSCRGRRLSGGGGQTNRQRNVTEFSPWLGTSNENDFLREIQSLGVQPAGFVGNVGSFSGGRGKHGTQCLPATRPQCGMFFGGCTSRKPARGEHPGGGPPPPTWATAVQGAFIRSSTWRSLRSLPSPASNLCANPSPGCLPCAAPLGTDLTGREVRWGHPPPPPMPTPCPPDHRDKGGGA